MKDVSFVTRNRFEILQREEPEDDETDEPEVEESCRI